MQKFLKIFIIILLFIVLGIGNIFSAEDSIPFTDINPGEPYYGATKYLWEIGAIFDD